MADGSAPRVAAARTVQQVVEQGRSLSDALPRQLAPLKPADRGLAQELSYGTLRWYRRLEAIVGQLLKKPFKSKDSDLHALLLIGAYQLLYLEVPAHAAVATTVDGVTRLDKGWARGLVNGVLRNLQRQHATLEARADRKEGVRLAHPEWLLERLRTAWPEAWEAIAAANNAHPPMALRVNLARTSRDDYQKQLALLGIAATADPHSDAALVLERPLPVERLPGFRDGLVSVQDAAAQLAAPLLSAEPGERVLDACAAPGGKTGHILERQPGLSLTALDISRERLEKVGENLARLGVEATLTAGDAAAPDTWWDGQPFDRILLDAPCSATGVIRRHPDIKLLRRAEDIDALVATQRRILDAAWPLLAPGGVLLYATCSILPEENEAQVAAFIERTADATVDALPAEWGRSTGHGRQILPGEGGMDGFFYARLFKSP